MASSQSSKVSRLPERHEPVADLLAELDRCLNTLTDGPGPNIADLFPRLRREFWRASSLVAQTYPRPPEPPLQFPSADVRDWPAFLQRRIPEERLLATLYPVFNPFLSSIKALPRRRQRLTRVCNVFGQQDLLFILNFGPDITQSESALQALASFHHHNRTKPLAEISHALWIEALSRPFLPDDEPPVPTPRELTTALKKLDPTFTVRGSSAGNTSTVSSSKAAGKRKARNPAAEEEDENGQEAEDDTSSIIEENRAGPSKRPRLGSGPSTTPRLQGGMGHSLLGGDDLDETPAFLDDQESPSPSVFHSAQEGSPVKAVGGVTARSDILEQFIAMGDPEDEQAEYGDSKLHGIHISIYSLARIAARLTINNN